MLREHLAHVATQSRAPEAAPPTLTLTLKPNLALLLEALRPCLLSVCILFVRRELK